MRSPHDLIKLWASSILALFFTVICSGSLYSQLPRPTITSVWDKTFGSSQEDWLSDVLVISETEYLLAGTSAGGRTADKSAVNWGLSDFWVIKIDSEGNKLWDATFGGNENDNLRAALPHVDGGFVLFGISRSDISGNRSAPKLGDFDVWLVKINSSGVKEWDKSFAATGSIGTRGMDIQPTPDGGYWMALFTGTSCHPDDVGYTSTFIKIDPSGNIEKEGNLCVGVNNILYTNDGNLVIDEYDISTDAWRMSKVTGDLETVWDRGYGITSLGFHRDDSHYDLIEAADGNYLVLGRAIGSGLTNYGFMAKINSARGELIRKKFYGAFSMPAPGGEYFHSGVIGTDGSIVALGVTNARIPSNHVSQSGRGGFDYWTVAISALSGASGTGLIREGKVIWDKRYGGTGYDHGHKIARISSSEYLLAGSSNSNISIDKSENSRGGQDFWVIKIREAWAPTIVITWPRGIPLIPPFNCEGFDHVDRPIPCEWELFTGILPLPNFNIMPQFTQPVQINSVQFKINGRIIGIDNEAPFIMFDPPQLDQDKEKLSLEEGTYELEIMGFSEPEATGKIIEVVRGNLHVRPEGKDYGNKTEN